jgi:CO/xanthine dehydrogenase FAD-binding subunit
MRYLSPTTLKEAVDLVSEKEFNPAIISGCTDILVKKNFFENKDSLIDITSINEINEIKDTGDKIQIGAGVTFTKLKDSKLIKECCKSLYQASYVFGSVQIRNRGTIAGNIVNASPAADSIPSLMTSNAVLVLVSKEGEERVNIKNFFTGPGKTVLKQGQLLAFIEIKKDTPETISFYRKIGTRKALSIAKASVAFKATCNNKVLSNVELAFGSVGPTVIASKTTKEFLEGKTLNLETIEMASAKAFEEVSPIDDIRSKAEYRRLVVKNVIIEELKEFIN